MNFIPKDIKSKTNYKYIIPCIIGFIIFITLNFSGCIHTGETQSTNIYITTAEDKKETSTELETTETATETITLQETTEDKKEYTDFDISDIKIPEYDGKLSVEINNNVPYINRSDIDEFQDSFIKLSELDDLGRCGTAYMLASKDTLATEEREGIGHIKPSGWHTVKYPELIPDNYLYNRSHLLMYAISNLNDDERNLITGTRKFNADQDAGMLHYEDLVYDYLKAGGGKVLYRVTPVYGRIFNGNENNLLADGVLMEALSIEDDSISFCVFVYNVQCDEIFIDYATGDSYLINDTQETTEETKDITYILNTNTMKIHLPGCSSVKDIKPNNKKETSESIDELEKKGYCKCKRCF